MTSTESVRPPVRATEPRERIRAAVVAAHGGSGATTVARLTKLPEADAQVAASLPAMIVTARTTGPGLAEVVALMARLPRTIPAVLVLTADAPLPLPPQARASLRLLRGRFTQTIQLPYVPPWRYRAPVAATASRRWRRSASEIPKALNHMVTTQGDLE